MLFTAPEQFVVLAMLLLGGVLIGFALAPSPKKWKRRVIEQSSSFTDYHRDAEDRLRAANQRATDLKAEADALRADHAEAERTIASLRAAAAAVVPAETAPRPALSLVGTTPAIAVPPEAPVAPEPPVEPPVEPTVAPVVAEPEPEPVVAPAPMAETAPAPGEPVPERLHTDEIIDVVLDPQRAAEIVPEPVTVHAVTPAPEPVAPVAAEPVAAEPHASTEPRLLADVLPAAYLDTHDSPPVFKPVEVAPMTPTPTGEAPAPIGAAEPEMPSKGWFASSARDDLTRLRGIDPVLNTRLFGLGVTRFEDVEKLSAEDEMALEQRLALPVGYVAREQWRTQAALLRAGQDAEHAAHFAPLEAATPV